MKLFKKSMLKASSRFVYAILFMLSAAFPTIGWAQYLKVTNNNGLVYYHNSENMDHIELLSEDYIGVYFMASDSNIEIDFDLPEEATFTIPVYREGITEAATYKFTSTASDNDAFTIADEVIFREGAKQAEITIHCNPYRFTIGQPKTIKLTLEKNVPLSAYGTNTITVTLHTSGNTWYPFLKGTGTYEYVFYWSGNVSGLPISYRYQIDDPTIWDLIILRWGPNKVGLNLSYAPSTNICQVEMTNTGEIYPSYGPIYVMDYGAFLYAIGYNEQANEYMGKSHYDPETGLFTLCVTYFIMDEDGYVYTFGDDAGGIAYDYEYFQMDGFGDYTANIEYVLGASAQAKARKACATEKGLQFNTLNPKAISFVNSPVIHKKEPKSVNKKGFIPISRINQSADK